MRDFSPFICLLPLTPGVYSQGTEAGTLGFREVESNKGPGPTQFTLTYVLLIGLTGYSGSRKLHAADDIFLQTDSAGPSCEFWRTQMWNRMFHLMGFWGKVQMVHMVHFFFISNSKAS